ncbi:8261_t:CDS:1, partial [Cetraspora pellucida]
PANAPTIVRQAPILLPIINAYIHPCLIAGVTCGACAKFSCCNILLSNTVIGKLFNRLQRMIDIKPIEMTATGYVGVRYDIALANLEIQPSVDNAYEKKRHIA